jgi:flagellar hook-associated protein 2
MGVRVPGASRYSGLVDQLVAAEKIPVEQAKKRKEKIVDEKKEVEKLQKFLGELDTAASAVKTKTDFYKMKVESSHPDILEGQITGFADPGTYEFEVRGLAKSDKHLAFGFPDKDKTAVGFGWMQIARDDMEPAELVIQPGSTLDGVAQQINDAGVGVRALVINTKYNPDPYRLLLISEKSGEEARFNVDPDTTFLEFKEQVVGRNLDVLFEDVPVTGNENKLDELINGVNFHVKRSEPGTRIQVNITHDADKTIEGIKTFVDKYNQIVRFAAEQSKDPAQGQPGLLSGDGSVKQIMRGLQESLFPSPGAETKFHTLAEVGITTNPKSGELTLDESKLRGALTDDYEGVAQLFVRSRFGDGVGERIAAKLKAFRDPESGAVRARIRGLDKVIENQDKEITRRERSLEDKEQAIKRRFASLESTVNGLEAQGSFLQQRFGGGDQPQGGG